jgi:hypothetical protein
MTGRKPRPGVGWFIRKGGKCIILGGKEQEPLKNQMVRRTHLGVK